MAPTKKRRFCYFFAHSVTRKSEDHRLLRIADRLLYQGVPGGLPWGPSQNSSPFTKMRNGTDLSRSSVTVPPSRPSWEGFKGERLPLRLSQLREKSAKARNSSQKRFTTLVRAAAVPLSRSIAQPFTLICWKVRSSAMRRELLRELSHNGSVVWN